ncbi:MAG: methyltransferase domain-containing protein, partial [Alphaproteobacteria bacterium]
MGNAINALMAPLSVLNPEHILFDRAAVRKHRDRAANLDWPHHRFLFQEVAERLAERLFDITTPFDLALDLGSRGGEFGEALMATGRIGNVVRADLSEDMLRLGSNPAPKVVTDEEFLPFRDNAFDLVGSVLDLHWTNDLPGALSLITRCLKPNGVFLGALFGVDSLRELKLSLTEAEAEIRGGVSPRISPFTEVRDAGSLLQRAGLALPVTDVDVLTLEYPHPFALMKELRGLGEANALISREKSFTSCS